MRNILHIALAGLLFVAQSGILVHQHFCKERLMATRLFVKAPGCHQASPVKACPMHQGAQKQDRKKCCDDRAEYVAAHFNGVPGSQVIMTDLDLMPALPALPQAEIQIPAPHLTQNTIQIHGPPPDLRKHASWLQVFRC